MKEITEQPKPLWYHYNQNNSGGYFVSDDNVGEDVFIQAYSAEEANELMEAIVYSSYEYSSYCHCCGERWYINARQGYDEPSKYGKSIFTGYKSYDPKGHAILYGLNGRKAKLTRDELIELSPANGIE